MGGKPIEMSAVTVIQSWLKCRIQHSFGRAVKSSIKPSGYTRPVLATFSVVESPRPNHS